MKKIVWKNIPHNHDESEEWDLIEEKINPRDHFQIDYDYDFFGENHSYLFVVFGDEFLAKNGEEVIFPFEDIDQKLSDVIKIYDQLKRLDLIEEVK